MIFLPLLNKNSTHYIVAFKPFWILPNDKIGFKEEIDNYGWKRY
jgi:hypothetical protein